jgi:formylglycine-generating enzyme required for sulfatase activity
LPPPFPPFGGGFLYFPFNLIYTSRMRIVRHVFVFSLMITLCTISGAQAINMVLVEGGSFQMGGSGEYNEKPVHTVTVSSFSIGMYEVSQEEWVAVMGDNPSHFKGDTLPVEQISWYEVIEFCNKLSLKEGLTPVYRGREDAVTCDFTANGYRLPTEAEWEYAARAGNKDYLLYDYAGGNNVDSVGWYNANSGGTTHPVGSKAANSLGIYDMSGNVWEWCWDWYGSYGSGNQTDPKGPANSAASGVYRVVRGGGGNADASSLRLAYRGLIPPTGRGSYLGFRLCRSGL